jgi:non-heme chloroperoxidase
MPAFRASDGALLHFECEGVGPPVVLVHGFASSPGIFEAQARALSSTHTVYRPHLRGHGRSADVTYGGRMTRLAGDLNDLLEAERLDRVHFVGWSMGCSVIWSYLDAFGGAAAKSCAFLDEIPYVLESVETVGQPLTRIEPAPLTGLHGRFADPAHRVTAVEGFISGMLRSATAADRSSILEDAAKGATASAVSALLNSNATDFRDLIPRLAQPTLFVSGQQSFFRPEFFHWMVSVAPQARLVQLADTGHFMLVEAADAVSALLLGFLHSGVAAFPVIRQMND